jgi:hypothetical protein
VHRQHRLIQVYKDTVPTESGWGDPKAQAQKPFRNTSREPHAPLASSLTNNLLEAGA